MQKEGPIHGLESETSNPKRPRLDPDPAAASLRKSSGSIPELPDSSRNNSITPVQGPSEGSNGGLYATALGALQYLPIPTVVVSPGKTVLLANKAFDQLVDLDISLLPGGSGTTNSHIKGLSGHSVDQIGIELVSNPPSHASWEALFDSVTPRRPYEEVLDGIAPYSSRVEAGGSNAQLVVDVLLRKTSTAVEPHANSFQHATMTVTTWSIGDIRYYTLTFAASLSADSNEAALVSTPHYGSVQVDGAASDGLSLDMMSKPQDVPPLRRRVSQLKGTVMESIHIPAYAIWRDQEFGTPNPALRTMVPTEIQYDLCNPNEFLEHFEVWTENFDRVLRLVDLPILESCRTQKPFESCRIGIKHPATNVSMVFEVRVESLQQPGREYLGNLITFQDVSDYAMELAVQVTKYEDQFEYIANCIPIMVWTRDSNGKANWFSRRWYDYTGMTRAEALGTGWEKAIEQLPDMATQWEPSDSTLRRPSGDTFNEQMSEYRCQRHDGVWRWMFGRTVPLRNENGKVVKSLSACIDIHDTVTARQEAKARGEQLLRVMEHAQVTLWAVDNDFKLTLLEGSPLWQSQSPDQSTVGDNVYELTRKHRGDDDARLLQTGLERILHARSKDETIEMNLDSESRCFRTRLLPIHAPSDKLPVGTESAIIGAIGVSMDVTELRVREQELKEQEAANETLKREEAAANNANAMKSQFLANMSHEIRTPIAGVIGMVELLLDTELNTTQREWADNIRTSANALHSVINDILDLSKVESGQLDVELVPFNLSVVLLDVEKMMSFTAGKKDIMYEQEIEPIIENELRIMGDPGRVRQILTNLLTNSIKFTTVGTVRLIVTVVGETEDTLTIQFVVQDTGIGIEEEVQQKLFKPFTQADSSTARRFGGTGLGLTISKNLVELMHGTINLESKLNEGTKMTFSVPFAKLQPGDDPGPSVTLDSIPQRLRSEMSISHGSEEVTPPSTPVRATGSSLAQPHSRGNSISAGITGGVQDMVLDSFGALPESQRAKMLVLIVEDNSTIQTIAIKNVERLKFSTKAVWNGQQALDYLQTAANDKTVQMPDIILMDVQMPVLDGYAATKLIRQSKKSEIRDVRIIAMTASAIQGDKAKCENAGMDDYLCKPVRSEDLNRMLVKWMTQENRRPPLKVEVPSNGDSSGEPVTALPSSRTANKATDTQNENMPPQEPFHLRPDMETAASSSSTTSKAGSASQRLGKKQMEEQAETALARSSETENDRAVRAVEAEERASDLRDAKLFGGTAEWGVGNASRMGVPSHELTRENMGILASREVNGTSDMQIKKRDGEASSSHQRQESVSSLLNNASDSPDTGTSVARSTGLSLKTTALEEMPTGPVQDPRNVSKLRGYGSAPPES